MILKSLFFMAVLFLGPAMARAEGLSDSEIKQILIQKSIASYFGNCPCPYNRASNGSKCGKRSAWSRPGGASPLCYEGDVSSEAVEEYKEAASK